MGQTPTMADVALAALSAPLAADPELREYEEVKALLAWGLSLVPADVSAAYRA